ncbi:hypothetical protein OUZ56_015365 [Daphnia magna]|uniref:Uncharacterized protein n=1 Tax=Daphnia magna TaxID=35525 RepID=A0ABR0AMM7_9CRUS|nr:hypothetical protein OUZ56_015365 [Daphnia magna]
MSRFENILGIEIRHRQLDYETTPLTNKSRIPRCPVVQYIRKEKKTTFLNDTHKTSVLVEDQAPTELACGGCLLQSLGYDRRRPTRSSAETNVNASNNCAQPPYE